MTPTQRAAVALTSAVLIGSGIAAPMVAEREGWVTRGYVDPVGIKTRCLGSTKGAVVVGQEYPTEVCLKLFQDDLFEHGMGTAMCLPADLPPETRAAFISFGYNVGVAKFCASTLAQKARAGDLRGACGELTRWVYAGGVKLNGLVKRRADEQALCLKGLA